MIEEMTKTRLYTTRKAPILRMMILSIDMASMKILYCGIKRTRMKMALINWLMERSLIIYQNFSSFDLG